MASSSRDREDGGEEEEQPTLILGRARRSTAGNRMRALLDQQTTLEDDEMFREEEDDNEFETGGLDPDLEQDVFDSDFNDSSDEEQGSQQGEDGQGNGDVEPSGERELQEEEQQRRAAAKKTAKNRMAPSIMRRSKPAAPSNSADPAGRKRISFAAPEPSDGDAAKDENRRVSSRRATVQSAQNTKIKLQEAEERRLQHPMVRNPPSQQKKPSLNQAELIELALEREEENRQSLKVFLEGEEERKRKELVRDKREMPTQWIRWRSVGTRVPIRAIQPVGVSDALEQAPSNDANQDGSGLSHDDGAQNQHMGPQAEENAQSALPAEANAQGRPQAEVNGPSQGEDHVESAATEQAKSVAAPTQQDQQRTPNGEEAIAEIPAESHSLNKSNENTQNTSSTTSLNFTLDPVLQARKEAAALAANEADRKAVSMHGAKAEGSENEAQFETQSRTLISLHFTEHKPNLKEQWSALLGTHSDWSSPKIVPSRHRPLKPRASVCAISGKMARYRDSKTGLPFADVRAARLLSQLREQKDWEWMELTKSVPTHDAGGGDEAGVQQPKEGAGGDDQQKQPTRKSAKTRDGMNRPSGFFTGFWAPAGHREGAPQPVPFLQQQGSPLPTAGSASSPGAKTKNTNPLKRKAGWQMAVVPADASLPPHLRGVAPGDEKAVLAKALALPEGTTRSGRARASMGKEEKK
ncbi:unnamed protein product [Jaminaea pallidilutea]